MSSWEWPLSLSLVQAWWTGSTARCLTSQGKPLFIMQQRSVWSSAWTLPVTSLLGLMSRNWWRRPWCSYALRHPVGAVERVVPLMACCGWAAVALFVKRSSCRVSQPFREKATLWAAPEAPHHQNTALSHDSTAVAWTWVPACPEDPRTCRTSPRTPPGSWSAWLQASSPWRTAVDSTPAWWSSSEGSCRKWCPPSRPPWSGTWKSSRAPPPGVGLPRSRRPEARRVRTSRCPRPTTNRQLQCRQRQPSNLSRRWRNRRRWTARTPGRVTPPNPWITPDHAWAPAPPHPRTRLTGICGS